MCLGVVLFGSILFGTVLSGLVYLFHLLNWGSFISLFFQISFQFLALFLLLLAPLSFKCWYVWRCPWFSLAYPCFWILFFNSNFTHLPNSFLLLISNFQWREHPFTSLILLIFLRLSLWSISWRMCMQRTWEDCVFCYCWMELSVEVCVFV